MLYVRMYVDRWVDISYSLSYMYVYRWIDISYSLSYMYVYRWVDMYVYSQYWELP